jgi:hypothetical protein
MHGVLLLPLLMAAAACQESENDTPPETLTQLDAACAAAIVDADVEVSALPLVDRMAIYQWATTLEVEAPAVPCGSFPYRESDCVTLIRGDGALLLDAMCRRYMVRPSTCLGFDPASTTAVDLDLAVAYRALSQERDAAGGEREVTDVFGDTHRVPARYLADVPGDARVVHADTYAKRAARAGLRMLPLSAGGLEGDGQIGMQQRFHQ